MNIVQKVRQLADAISANADPLQVQRDWELVERLLGRLPASSERVREVCRSRDAPALDALVAAIERPAAPPAPAPPPPQVSRDDMAAAMRVFRKRLKLARLADESKLGGRQLSGGRRSAIDAIQAPIEYPRPVWDALVAAGELADAGQGFYARADERRPPRML